MKKPDKQAIDRRIPASAIRGIVRFVVAIAAVLPLSVACLAQEAYPARAITMISPFPPGGVSDTITRPLDAALETVFKQPVVLENKTGAAGAVAARCCNRTGCAAIWPDRVGDAAATGHIAGRARPHA